MRTPLSNHQEGVFRQGARRHLDAILLTQGLKQAALPAAIRTILAPTALPIGLGAHTLGPGCRFGLGPIWKPFLIGCLVCSIVAGVLGWGLLELFWRYNVRRRYRTRAWGARR